jgi:hypothetical protein
VGVNCSSCDCSTRNWLTLFGHFNQFSLLLTTSNPVNPACQAVVKKSENWLTVLSSCNFSLV